MNRPWLAPLVILFWLITTGWLVIEKIAPTLMPGSAPGSQALYAVNNRLIPVGWEVQWNEQPLGWAVSHSVRGDDGSMVVQSLLHFDTLPIDEMLPTWTKLIARRALHRNRSLAMEARGQLMIDAKGTLTSFQSAVDLPGTADKVLLNGTISNGDVTILVRARDFKFETTRYLPAGVTLGDELSPQATLPGLYHGRRWTVPMYSPVRAAPSPIDILHAEVSGGKMLTWQNAAVPVDLVVYREDPTSSRPPRSRLWVDHSGRVLKQETATMGSRLTFLRLSDKEAEGMADKLVQPPEQTAAEPTGKGKQP